MILSNIYHALIRLRKQADQTRNRALVLTLLTTSALLLQTSATNVFAVKAQTASNAAAPKLPAGVQRQRLLNDLDVLLQPQPGQPDVTLLMRFRSGAAFDLAGKEGTMRLLADALFPDPTTREYIADEYNGRLNVKVDQDTLTIEIGGRANGYENYVELLRNALLNTSLTNETIAPLREARIKEANAALPDDAAIADQAAAMRLFGQHPYARTVSGTPASLARIERADLLFARERFLNPNNATLVISGGVAEVRAMRALRQQLGNWRRSDTIIPATFRQPEPPPARPLLINTSGKTTEVRLALRTAARTDADRLVTELLARVVEESLRKSFADLSVEAAANRVTNIFARQESYRLSGRMIVGATLSSVNGTGATFVRLRDFVAKLGATPVTAAEADQAKRAYSAELNARLQTPEQTLSALIDGSLGLPRVEDDRQMIDRVTNADLNRLAAKLFGGGSASIASVIAGDANALRAQLIAAKIEVDSMVAVKK